MVKNCASCRWFNPDFAPDDDPEYALGQCKWPSERLPYSLRYGSRERLAVHPIDGGDCSCFELKFALSSLWTEQGRAWPMAVTADDVALGNGVSREGIARSGAAFTLDPAEIDPAGVPGLEAILAEDHAKRRHLRPRGRRHVDRSHDWDEDALALNAPNEILPDGQKLTAYAVRTSDRAFLGVVSFGRWIEAAPDDAALRRMCATNDLDPATTDRLALTLRVEFLYVRPRYRGQGYGYHLIEALRRTVDADIDAIAARADRNVAVKIGIHASIASEGGAVLSRALADAVQTNLVRHGMARAIADGHCMAFCDVESQIEEA